MAYNDNSRHSRNFGSFDSFGSSRSFGSFSRSHLTVSAAAVLIALIVLLIACFSAFTLNAAQTKMDESKAYKNSSQNYYATETTAAEIIADFSKAKKEGMSNLNGITVYKASQGEIEVTKIDGSIYFSVPVNKTESLKVEAKVTKKDTEIIKWYLTKR